MLKVKEIMIRRVESVNSDQTIQDAILKMKSMYIGLLPVCSDNKLIGMLSVHDIAVYLLAGGDNIKNKIKVSALMKSDFGYCYENDDVKKVREIMEKNEYMHLPVLTADKRLAGMVSLADLLTCEEVSKVSVNV